MQECTHLVRVTPDQQFHLSKRSPFSAWVDNFPKPKCALQGANLWEFETWGKDKDKDKDKDSKDKAKEKPSYTSEFKLGMLVELERLRVGSFHKRRVADGAFEYAEGIFYSGLLHESQKSHLRKVLNRRQTEAGAHEKQMTLSHRQIMQAR
jgi:hypothetical protein